MSIYARQIATAKRVIKKKGRACVWNNVGNAPNAARPWKPGARNPNAHNVHIAFFNETSSKDLASLATLMGTDIVVGDDYGLMPAVSFVPTAKAEIYAADGTTLLRTVNTIDALAPNGDVILYTIKFEVVT